MAAQFEISGGGPSRNDAEGRRSARAVPERGGSSARQYSDSKAMAVALIQRKAPQGRSAHPSHKIEIANRMNGEPRQILAIGLLKRISLTHINCRAQNVPSRHERFDRSQSG